MEAATKVLCGDKGFRLFRQPYETLLEELRRMSNGASRGREMSRLDQLASVLQQHGEDWYLKRKLDDAVKALEVASEIYRLLANEPPQQNQSDLARSLHWLGLARSKSGDYEGGLAAYDEAILTRRNLVTEQSSQSRSDLAISLRKRGTCCYRLQRYASGLDSCTEAVRLLHHIAEADPYSDQAELADSFACLAAGYQISRRYEEALDGWKEAGRLLQKLAAEKPKQYFGPYGDSLSHLAGSLFDLAHYEECLHVPEKCIQAHLEAHSKEDAGILQHLFRRAGAVL